MHTRASSFAKHFYLALLMPLLIAASACQQGTGTNANSNITNSNANTATIANSNLAPVVDASAVINTREPEKYKATMVLSIVTEGGEKAVGIPELRAEVARNGADRRLAFPLPNNEQLIYLDRADKPIVIAPSRKQYAELTPDATGFQLQRMMTPGQMVALLEKQKGYEHVGEEQYNGRATDKYRFSNTTQTGTQAGAVKSEAYVYVDKETGLPLHAEINSEATNSVQGMKGARIVVEMKDLTTNVDPAIFEIPQGYAKVSPEQIRQQIDALTATVAAVLKALVSNMNTGGGTTTVTASPAPSTSPSPSATATP